MKILLINRCHFIQGGADKVYHNMGKLLKDNDYEIAYFSTKNEKNFDSHFSKYFIDNPSPRQLTFISKISSLNKYLYNAEASRNLNSLISDFKPNIAHVHLFYGSLSSSILKTLKKNKIPIILTVHDYRLLCPANAMLDRKGKICEMCKNSKFYYCTIKRCSSGNLFYSLIITLEAYIRSYLINPIKYVDHFIFVSKFSMNKHLEFDKGYSNKSSILYNFAETFQYENIIKGEFLLYYGRLSKEKGIENLIKVAIKKNIKLIIAGDGPIKNDICNSIKKYKNIEYVGFKSGNELTELICKSSFVVVPSEWYENNPMTIVEAFSLSKPVIGSNIGGIPELVGPTTGLIFDPGDLDSLSNAVEMAIKMEIDDYTRISKNCWDFSQKFLSKERYFEELNNIYKMYN